MSQLTCGKIVNYRIGTGSQMPKWCLVQIKDAHSSSEVGRLVGRKVVVKYEENKFVGRILGVHGRNGVVRVKFKRGLPGSAIGATAELIG